MEDTIVKYVTAKLAVSKGYEGFIGTYLGHHYYNHNGILDGDVIEQLKETIRIKNEKGISFEDAGKLNTIKSYPAPTQSLLQKWLRDNFNIHIEIIMVDTLTCTYAYHISSTGNGIRPDSKLYESYEECLEDGLLESLELIKL